MRESTLRTGDAVFFQKPSVQIEGRAVYDSWTARETRNRAADLIGGRARAAVRLPSDVHADMEVGDTFAFADDMSDLSPYPVADSSGAWSGRTHMAVETHQHFGSSWHTEIVAVDVDL
jgi:hypothetical protein